MSTRHLVPLFIAACAVVLVPFYVNAATQNVSESDLPPRSSSEEVRNQTQTQNSGEDYQIQIQETQETNSSFGKGSVLDQFLGENEVAETSAQAQRRVSDVTAQVQRLLSGQGAAGDVGEEFRAFAREQDRIQERIQMSLQDIQQRSRLMQLIMGPNYGATEELKNQLEATEQQVSKLRTLRDTAPAADQSTITGLQMGLQAQEDALTQAITAQEEEFSLFGWVVKFFARVLGS